MSVADYMSTKLIVITPQTTVSVAIELMKTNAIHRLPVLDGSTLVGIVTQGIIARALPSQATSLSVYETNYLLTKTTCLLYTYTRPRDPKKSRMPSSA